MRTFLAFLGVASIAAIIFFGFRLADKNQNSTAVATPSPSPSPTVLSGEGVKTYITFSGNTFQPADLEVRSGTMVVFINNDTASRSVVNETFDSGPIPPIGSFANKFEGKGIYKIYLADKGEDKNEVIGTITVQ